MKRTLLLLIALTATALISIAQTRHITRGAEPGELYLATDWWGNYVVNPSTFDTLRTALFRLTENGKKLTVQYDADGLFNIGNEVLPRYIMADATPGVIYNFYLSMSLNLLHVSFDYGKNWVFRRSDTNREVRYIAVNEEGIIYGSFGTFVGAFKSNDYGVNFIKINNRGFAYQEAGLEECEFFLLADTYGYGILYHTTDCFENSTQTMIDGEYANNSGGWLTSAFRGGLPNEIYIDSWHYNFINYAEVYKVSFSDDLGQSFRHIFEWELIPDSGINGKFPFFMSDREPGVFYIIWSGRVEVFNPWGFYRQIIVDYYRDYGATLEATFCHNITKDYEYEEVVCNNETYLEIEKVGENSVMLQWASSADAETIRGYRVYRKSLPPAPSEGGGVSLPFGEGWGGATFYLDENLPADDYEYYIRTFHNLGCVSDVSNVVTVTIEVKYEITFEVKASPQPPPKEGETPSPSGRAGEGLPIAEATIIINETVLTTNEQGIAVISLISGSYPFTVSKTDYIEFSESVLVDGAPQTVDVTMVKETFEIIFEVVDEKTEQPIAEAEIIVENFENSFFTDEMGIAKFFSKTGSFSYIVTKENYNDYIGVLIVENSAVTERVKMTEWEGIEQLQITNYELRVYPNPTSGQLMISDFPISDFRLSDNRISHIEIYDITGRVVFTSSLSLLSPETILDISELPSGVYFMRVGNEMVKVVKR